MLKQAFFFFDVVFGVKRSVFVRVCILHFVFNSYFILVEEEEVKRSKEK